MLSLMVSLVLLAPPRPVVAVVDVSRPDAVYEDVSRALADDVVAELAKVRLDASRVEEQELQQEGCRAGPCLEAVARARAAHALVLLDANEKGPVVEVSVTALRASDGRPLGPRGTSRAERPRRPWFGSALAQSLGAAVGGR